MKVLMTIVKSMSTSQAKTKHGDDVLSNTSSVRCANHHCAERLWIEAYHDHNANKLIECHKCGRINLFPLHQTELEEFKS